MKSLTPNKKANRIFERNFSILPNPSSKPFENATWNVVSGPIVLIMKNKKLIHVGKIKESDLKVRKKKAPPTQVQKSSKDYDRKRLKAQSRKEEIDEET